MTHLKYWKKTKTCHHNSIFSEKYLSKMKMKYRLFETRKSSENSLRVDLNYEKWYRQKVPGYQSKTGLYTRSQHIMAHGINVTNHRPNLATPICLHIVYGCLHAIMLSSCKKNHMAHKAENVYYLGLFRESLPTSHLHEKKKCQECHK